MAMTHITKGRPVWGDLPSSCWSRSEKQNGNTFKYMGNTENQDLLKIALQSKRVKWIQ